MLPKVSIVIPIYNGEKYLHQALNSILTQTMQDFEIICVDDCSTDSSREIIKEYAARDKRVKYIFHDKNKLTLQSRKDGALYSSGQYVMFMDQDDYFEPNAFEVACRTIEEKGTDLVQFGTIVENCGNLPEHTIAFMNKFMQGQEGVIHGNINLLNGCFADRYERKFAASYVWNRIYDGDLCRRAFAAVEDGSFPSQEDSYYTFLTLYYAESAAIIKDKLYHYCYGRGFTGHTKISVKQFARICEVYLMLDAVKRFIARQPDSEQEELYPAVKFMEKWAVNNTLFALKKVLPDDWKIEDVRAICSSLALEDTAFVIACLQEKLEEQKKELLNYSSISFARIDIKNHGADTNSVDIVEISDPDAKIVKPSFLNKNGHGCMIWSVAGSLDMKLKFSGQGKLIITLRGMSFSKPDGSRWPIWIDYTKFIVDNKVIFDGVKPIWHGKPYKFTEEVEDGKIVTLHIEWVADNVTIGLGKAQSCDMQEHAIEEAKAEAAKEHRHSVELDTKLNDATTVKMELENANKDLETQLANIRSGMSFRIGRIITYIPRKILGRK